LKTGVGTSGGNILAGQPRAWQRMLSGRRLNLLDPDPADIDITDIAHGLSRVARWNGQTLGKHAFSVAEHSLLVEEIASALAPGWSRQWQLAALLHDAPEYVIGDLISPFKAAIGLDYKAFERRLMIAIHSAFELPGELPEEIRAAIKLADRVAAYFEATRLAGFTETEADHYFGKPVDLPEFLILRLCSIDGSPVERVQASFVGRFHALMARS